MRIEIVIADDVRWDLRATLLRAGFEVVACGSDFRVRIGGVALGPTQARVRLVVEPTDVGGASVPAVTGAGSPCDVQRSNPCMAAVRDITGDARVTPNQAANQNS